MSTTTHTAHGDLAILRSAAVVAKTGISLTGVYELIAAGDFPPPITLSKRRVGWLLHEVEDWIRERARATREDGLRAQTDQQVAASLAARRRAREEAPRAQPIRRVRRQRREATADRAGGDTAPTARKGRA
jgi:prophage regulatory protein